MRASWVSAGPETPALQQLKEAGSQVSRGPTSPGPSEDLESRPRTENSPRTAFGGADPASLPWAEDLTLPPLGPLWAPQRWMGTHVPSSFMGHFFFPNRGSGFVKGKEGYVQIPQEIMLSDSFPRTTWGLDLQFPPWF